MNNIVTFAMKQRRSFSELPFCSADSLILSWLSYLHLTAAAGWEGISFKELPGAPDFGTNAQHPAKRISPSGKKRGSSPENDMLSLNADLDAVFRNVWDTESSKALLSAVTKNPRYQNIRLFGFTEELDIEAQKQFAAVTFRLGEDCSYVAFRGTEANLLGWKEDFNMGFQYPIPSQTEAARYLKLAAKHLPGKLLLGGHSKGGNLAVFAAANSEEAVKSRIERIYAHDSPGFLKEVLDSPAFCSISGKIEKTLPQSSIIGMLLEQQGKFKIVKSNRFSLLQHDPFSWKTDRNDLHYIRSLSPNAHFCDQTLNTWVRSLTPAERERFVDALYELLDVDETANFASLLSNWQQNLPAIARAAAMMEPDKREFLVRTLRELGALAVKHFPEIFLPRRQRHD